MESESHRLVHSLTAHLALYHSRIYNQNPKPTPRDSILRWFSSLSSAHRQAALTIYDPSFIEILTQMQFRLCRHGHSQFLLLPDLLSSSHPSLPSLSFRPSRGLLSRSAASNTSAALLSNSILFFPSAPSGASSEEALTVSESLLTEVDRFVNVMDSLSGGRFLCEEIDTLGLTVQWVELPWLKDMGYYSLEAFIANRLEVVLRLAWIGSLGGKKPKEKRAKEMAAEVTGKAANTFWRMKGCLGWWIGLDPGARKAIISYFFGKGSKALANEIIKDKNTSLMNRFGFLNIGNVKLPHSASSSQNNHEQALFRRDANISLDFLPSKAPNNLVIIWNKLVVVHDISCMLLAWQSSKCAVEELFFGSLGSNLTVTHQITMKLQRLLMVVYTNFINHELMEDTKRNIYPGKKAEEKSNLVCQKVKSKSHSCSKKSNILHKACKESSKNLDDNSGHISSELSRCIVSCAINNVTEVKSLVVHEKLDNANVSTSDDYKKNKGKRKNRRKGAKNKSSNSKNIGVTNHEVNKDTFLSISTGRKPDGTCVAPSVCDISQEYMMINVFQSSQDIQNNQSLNLGRVSSTNYEECRHFSGENGSDMGKCVSPNKPLDAQASSTSGTSPSTCDLGSMATDGRQKHLISTVGKGTASKSFISNKCLNTAADEQRFIMHNNGNECYTDGGIDSMGGASNEWPSITPLHFSSINSHIFPATDRLHLDVGGRSPYHSHQSSLSSNAHVRNLFTGSVHGQILPSFTCPMSYDWPPMVKSCSICSQTQNISYESAYNLTMPSLCSRLALCANHGVQVIGDSDARHNGDIIDACDMKSISDLVEDESNWFSEEESEPHARPGRDYNKYFGDGVMYWNPTELVGIGFSRPPSHSSEDSSWAWHEADLNRTIDDMVGCKSGLPAYNTNGKASPPSSYCSPFDNLTSGHQSMGYTVAVNDGSNCAIHSSSISYSTEEKISSGTSKSTACIEGVNGDPSSYPILRPIIIPAMSRKGSRSDLRLGHDNRSSCLPSSRSDNPRIKRPPSPVVLCVPQVSRPPPGIGESRKRGLPTVRSGSSSPRHWGVKSFCHDEGTLADIRHCLDGAEVVWPVWARKGLGVTAVAQSLQGSLLQDHFINISQLAHDQEHPDVTLRLQCPELLNRHSKELLLTMQNLLHAEIDFFCKQME